MNIEVSIKKVVVFVKVFRVMVGFVVKNDVYINYFAFFFIIFWDIIDRCIFISCLV